MNDNIIDIDLSTIEDALSIGCYKLDFSSEKVKATPGFYDLMGLPSDSINNIDDLVRIFGDEEVEHFHEYIKAAEGGIPFDFEVRISENGRHLRWIKSVCILNPQKKNSSVIGVLQDISHLKEVEEAQKEAEDTLKHITDTIPGVVYQFKVEPDGNREFLFMSNGAERMFNLSANTIKEDFQSIWNKLHPKDQAEIAKSIERDNLKAQDSWTEEFRIINQGEVRWILGNSEPTDELEDGSIIRSGIFIDITERKKVEQELEHKSLLLEHAQKLSKMGVWKWNIEEDKISWSEELFNIYGLNPDTFESTFDAYINLVHKDDREDAKNNVLSALSNKQNFSSEERIVRPDGEIRVLTTWGDVITDSEGNAVELLGACIDITKRKQAEEQLRTSLAEKSVLLQEVHHRVKNNLAIISGLFELQSLQTSNNEARRLLRDSQLRVQSIAQIHEKLYQNESLSEISFKEYLEELIETIFKSIKNDETDIELILEIDDVNLNVNQAIPCGLIINELIVNAYKHAFPGRDSGTITISMSEDEDRTITFMVSDDGIGLDENVNFKRPKSLGLKLINTLCLQLNARLKLSNHVGVAAYVTFEKESKKGPSSNLNLEL